MSALTKAVDGLFEFLERQGLAPPAREVMVVEVQSSAIAKDGKLRVRRSGLLTLTDYNRRFEELMEAGLPWINVSCYGVLGAKLVVGIEAAERSVLPAARTSVNYSGPPEKVVARGWDVEELLAIE